MEPKCVLSACAFDCPDACGFAFDPASGEVRGRVDHPYTGGFVCHKLRGFLSQVGKREGRLTKPLLRDGGVLREVSWDRGLSVFASKLSEAVRKDPRRVLWATGSGNLRLDNRAFDLFSRALGGFTGLKGSLCGGEGGAGLAESYRVRRHVPPEEVLRSRRVILWGRNVAETNVHFVPLLAKARSLGVRVGYVDVRPTRTDGMADVKWTVRPGADLPLVLYLCGRIMESGVCSVEGSEGFEEFASLVRGVSRDQVLGVSGLSEEALEDMVRFLLGDGPLSVWAGWAVQRRVGGDLLMRGLDAMVFLLGSQDVPGGGMVFSADDEAPVPSDLVGDCFGRWAPRPSVGRFIGDAKEPPVEVAVFSRCNPVTQSQDAGTLEEVLKGEGLFSVCLDWRLSATARRCSLVIPVAPFPEQPKGVVFSYWHDLIQLVNPLWEVSGGPVPYEGEVLDRLLVLLGERPAVVSAAERVVRSVLSAPGLVEVAEGIWRFPHPRRHQGVFRFPGGKDLTLRFWELGVPKGIDLFELITPHRHDGVNGWALSEWAGGGDGPWACLSPGELRALGIAQGDEGWLESPFGRARVRFSSLDGLANGVCMVFSGQEGVNRLIGPNITPRWNTRLSEAMVRVRREG
ncbi:anaerobic dehydrogenase, typically selenocysteine-containing [Thermanaerovibrio velox DSM 12556]|uniref:Anaerobic dehydrogenase, typically selenocysteine-containing n=1 Tax=Thermanaerovibrio velox DSM 12556 TaxID=926567 RepID=H0UQQ9_9BACT|nr:molybdopterin-dependent oxidoreductase [Thermanaerovibrio velox]EHM10823.1 anaerobic dehydrogenase, typically selenocysteine-containing [Thermanaerovibrio velox DSM 12556]